MGVDLLQLGVSGLLTAQQQLSTAGHNIANVNTDGYSRQRVLQQTTTPVTSGSNFLGTGTRVAQVQRVFDQFRYNEVVFNQTVNSNAQTMSTKLGQLDDTMSRIGPNITNSVNDLFSAVNSLVDVPGDLGLREVMLAKASTLSQNVQSMQRTLNGEYQAINDDLVSSAAIVTSIAQQLAIINRDIVTASANQGSPSDLLDQRDKLITDLSQYTKVSTVAGKDGLLNVYISNGQSLVSGVTAFAVKTIDGDPDPRQLQLVIESPSGVQQNMAGKMIGGSLGALVDYRDGVLTDTINKLGQTSIAVAQTFNQAQSQGLDLNGLTGQKLFTDINDPVAVGRRVLAAGTNDPGNVAGGVEITDINQLSSDDFRLDYTGGTYTLTNLTSGKSEVMTEILPASPVGARSFETLDASGKPTNGFIFKEAGIPVDGDRFELHPTRLGANNLNVALTAPEQIAASSIAEVYASSDNVNSAKLEIVSINNPGAANFPTAGSGLSLEVYEAPAGTFNYQLLDSAGVAQPLTDNAGTALGTSATYTTGPLQFSAAGMSFKLSGQPSGQTSNAPEVYNIEYAFGEGNNKNLLAMAGLSDAKLMNQGRSSLIDIHEESITSVGSQTATARIAAGAAETLFNQASARMSNNSGVNLDEEASNLLRFQQAYSASARVISTANEIFQTLLQAAR